MPSCPLLRIAVAAAVAVVTISDPVALQFEVDSDIDMAHVVVADVDRIAVDMVDSGAVDSVGYCLHRDIAAYYMIPEVPEEDRSTHLQLLEPMLHNFARTAFVVVAGLN